MHYFCKKCNGKAVDTIKMMNGLKEKMDNVEKQVSTIASSVKTVEESVAKVTSTVNSIADISSPDFEKKLRNIAREEAYEQTERMSKRCNIVVSGIPEIKHKDEAEKKVKDSMHLNDCTDDFEIAEHILNEIDAETQHIDNVYRVPTTRRDGAPPRKLIITLKTRTAKYEVLRKAGGLREKDDDDAWRKYLSTRT